MVMGKGGKSLGGEEEEDDDQDLQTQRKLRMSSGFEFKQSEMADKSSVGRSDHGGINPIFAGVVAVSEQLLYVLRVFGYCKRLCEAI